MRRTSPDLSIGIDLLPERIRAAERHDPRRVIERLEPLVLPRRCERMQGVIAQRLASVAVLFDSPHDPHNGAAVIRSCDAFGVQGVHVVERVEPFLSANSVSRGTERWVDVNLHASPAEALRTLAAQGFELVGAEASGELVPSDLAKLPKVAVVLGNERDGITAELARGCRRKVRVPMRGFTDSLNVSVTCAILLSAATDGRKGDLPEEDRLRLYARGLYLSVDRPELLLQ